MPSYCGWQCKMLPVLRTKGQLNAFIDKIETHHPSSAPTNSTPHSACTNPISQTYPFHPPTSPTKPLPTHPPNPKSITYPAHLPYSAQRLQHPPHPCIQQNIHTWYKWKEDKSTSVKKQGIMEGVGKSTNLWSKKECGRVQHRSASVKRNMQWPWLPCKLSYNICVVKKIFSFKNSLSPWAVLQSRSCKEPTLLAGIGAGINFQLPFHVRPSFVQLIIIHKNEQDKAND